MLYNEKISENFFDNKKNLGLLYMVLSGIFMFTGDSLVKLVNLNFLHVVFFRAIFIMIFS